MVDGFLDGGQRLLPPPQVGQPDRQVVQRPGQVGPERVRAGRGQLPADGRRPPGSRPAPPPAAPGRPAGSDRLFSDMARSGRNASGRAAASSRRMVDGLLARGQRLLPPPQVAQPDRQVVQRHGQVGPERVRAGRGQLPADGRRPPGSRPAPPPAAPARPAGPTGCSATLARSGRNASGRAAASSRWMSTASWIAASASSRRPRSASRTDRLFSDMARSGRNASGRAAASSRRMVDGLLARGQRLLPPPQAGQPDRQVVQRHGQVGAERVRAGRGQLPVDGRRPPGSRPAPPPAAPGRPAGPTGCSATLARSGRNASGRAAASSRRMVDGLLDRGQRLLPPPQARPAGSTGCSASAARSGRNASGRAAASSRRMVDGLLARGQRLLPPPQLGQPVRQVVQRRGQVGPERVRAGRGQLPVDARRPPGSRPAPPPAAPGRPGRPTGCSASWPGRAGTRPGGPRPAPGGWSTASWIAASASSRRPRSASRFDRLFSDVARSGRNASGRAAASSR